MRTHTVALLLASTVASGCSMTVANSVLPPPPHSGIPHVEMFAIEDAKVFVDTTAPLVRDAASGQARVLPLRPEPVEGGGGPGELQPRFPRGMDPHAPTMTFLEALRDSVRHANLTWAPVEDLTDVLHAHHSWTALRSGLVRGASHRIRETVWPGELGVASARPDGVVLATNWVAARHIPANEMRCAAHLPIGRAEPGVRMLARVTPGDRSGARIQVEYETRGLAGCRASPVAWSRLSSFRQDVWMALHASSVGAQQVIWR